MNKHLSLLALLLLTVCRGFSQDSLRSGISQDSAIRATLVQGGKYPSLVYSANGQILDNREIITRLKLYDESADELQKYRNGRTGLVVWLGVMLGSGIAAAVDRQQGSTGAQYTLAGVAAGACIAAFVSGIRGSMHFDKAIKAYNKRFQE